MNSKLKTQNFPLVSLCPLRLFFVFNHENLWNLWTCFFNKQSQFKKQQHRHNSFFFLMPSGYYLWPDVTKKQSQSKPI